jgi:hypothetical protein
MVVSKSEKITFSKMVAFLTDKLFWDVAMGWANLYCFYLDLEEKNKMTSKVSFTQQAQTPNLNESSNKDQSNNLYTIPDQFRKTKIKLNTNNQKIDNPKSRSSTQTNKHPVNPISAIAPVNLTSPINNTNSINLNGSITSNNANIPKNNAEDKIFLELKKITIDLIGLETFIRQLADEINDFQKSSESRASLFWGESATGKTELAQRLAGLKQGYPKLRLDNAEVAYLSGVDGKFQIKDIVDKIPTGSVVLIDEADKCLDSNAGLVSQNEARQLQLTILNYYSSKKIYWIFLGTFSAMRGSNKITYSMVESTFGTELGSRIDFTDWEFPQWNIENLIKAAKITYRGAELDYSDEAMAIICQYCLDIGGGIRAFDTIDQSLHRKLRKNKITKNITLKVAQDILIERGYDKGQ